MKRGSSVDQVGLEPQSQVAPSNPYTGMVPIALPDAPMAPNLNDGGSRSIHPGTPVSVVKATPAFKANTGCDNP